MPLHRISFLMIALFVVTGFCGAMAMSDVVHAAGSIAPSAQTRGTPVGGTPVTAGTPVGGTDAPPSDSNTLTNPLKSISSLPQLMNAILDGVVEIGSILLTIMIVYVGFLFVAAQGNEEKIRSARSALVWTVVGGLILLGAKAISLVIQNTVSAL